MISVVVNTLNEEANLRDCLESVRGFADEIVVCDMHSDDGTVAIAREHGARVVFHERTGYVEPARHFAISEASHEWVLVLDADERLVEPLKSRLLEEARAGRYDLVYFWSLFWYFGGWVRHGIFYSGGWGRFFRKAVYLDRYSDVELYVHQGMAGLRTVTNCLELPRDYYIEHLAYPTIEKYLAKTLGTYARIEAEGMHQRGLRFRPLRLVLDPVKSWVSSYVLHRGYRDGMRGFILCVLYAGYRFAIWANLWLLEETRDRA